MEIGSSVRPEPYCKKTLKTYIQEYMDSHGYLKEISDYGLTTVELNVQNIERTFIDKVMSVKRHAICGTLPFKVRHIYDVVRLFQSVEIQSFIENTQELKRLVKLTKDTDAHYLEKRNISEEYDPAGAYNFMSWKHCFNSEIQNIYEHLHENLLYTDEKQNFEDAKETFSKINMIFTQIGE